MDREVHNDSMYLFVSKNSHLNCACNFIILLFFMPKWEKKKMAKNMPA